MLRRQLGPLPERWGLKMRAWQFSGSAVLTILVGVLLPVTVPTFLDPNLGEVLPSHIAGSLLPIFVSLIVFTLRLRLDRSPSNFEYSLIVICVLSLLASIWLHMFTTSRETFAGVHLLAVIGIVFMSASALYQVRYGKST